MKGQFNSVVVILLAVNLVVGIANLCSNPVQNLETLKVGGPENFTLVQELYKSEAYKAQQTQAINQVMAQVTTLESTTETGNVK